VIPPEFIQQLIGRLDIVDVVGQYVELKKAGANLKGLCPFHGEKSPSFNVSPTRQTYHCFGCGVHGDALKFVIEYQGLSFIDAIQELARRVGMEVPSDTRSAAEREQAAAVKEQRKGLSELLQQASDFYRLQLRDSDRAVDYLKRRGLTGRIAADFGLGYAPAGWRGLARCFPEYGLEDLETCGLVIAQEGAEAGEQKRYDRFRDRIMFPIRNVVGEVIGFGGRVLDQGEPKYLNSPETPVFIKGQELYGLFEARAPIRQKGYALVVEGYMDVVALAQHGIGQAVATLGTACTAEHVAKLFRFTELIVFSFDGDAAGRRAAGRALQAALPHLNERRAVRFLFLPSEHDPDSYVREHGAEGFERQVEAAWPLSRQLVAVASEGCRLDSPEGRTRMLAQGRPLWALVPDGLFKRQLLGEFAQLARLPEPELLRAWSDAPQRGAQHTPDPAGWDTERSPARRPRKPKPEAPRGPLSTPTAADQALRLLLTHSSWWEQLSPTEHEQLLALEAPHGPLSAWLDRTLAEEGALHWPALRERLAALPHPLLPDHGPLTEQALDALPPLEASLEDLRRLMPRLSGTEDISQLLGRAGLRFRT